MKKKRFINEKIAEVEEKIKKTTSRNSKIKLVSQLGYTFSGILGGILFLGGITSSIGCFSVAALCFILKNYHQKKSDNIIKNLNLEKSI